LYPSVRTFRKRKTFIEPGGGDGERVGKVRRLVLGKKRRGKLWRTDIIARKKKRRRSKRGGNEISATGQRGKIDKKECKCGGGAGMRGPYGGKVGGMKGEQMGEEKKKFAAGGTKQSQDLKKRQ